MSLLFEARTQVPEHGAPNAQQTEGSGGGSNIFSTSTLSISITSLMDGTINPGTESATLMAAIKSHETSVGERGARSEWVWECWDQFTFRKNSEVWGESSIINSLSTTDIYCMLIYRHLYVCIIL